MGTRRDVASRRSAPSGHVATTTRQRGPFSRCHKVPFLLAISSDDRQISSQDQRSVKLRVRPPLTGTHRCHEATPTGRGIMLTVKLTSLDQDEAN